MSNENQKPEEIPEDVQIGMKLEAIFTPQFKKKRDDLYGMQAEPGDTEKYSRFVHYTTAEAALNIIQSKRIWMRKTMCMSDYREVEHGFEILRNIFADESNLDLFYKALDSCVPGAAKEAIQLFNGQLGSIRSGTYIASISEHNSEENLHGRLSMWRAFGGDTGRVAIVLRIPWFTKGLRTAMQDLNLFFSPVVYLTKDDYLKEFQRIIENINSNHPVLCSVERSKIVNSIFHMLLTGTVCLKHYGFREEREWRVMHFPNLWPSSLMKHETKVIGGVPQKIYKLPLDAAVAPTLTDMELPRIFDRLIIGPTQYSWPMYEAFSEALSNIGVHEAHTKISISDIPIRT